MPSAWLRGCDGPSGGTLGISRSPCDASGGLFTSVPLGPDNVEDTDGLGHIDTARNQLVGSDQRPQEGRVQQQDRKGVKKSPSFCLPRTMLFGKFAKYVRGYSPTSSPSYAGRKFRYSRSRRTLSSATKRAESSSSGSAPTSPQVTLPPNTSPPCTPCTANIAMWE